MKLKLGRRSLSQIVWGIAVYFITISAVAHPEDEFCDQANTDVLLCSELAELDRAEASFSGLPQIDLDRSPLDTLLLYVQLGSQHIVPLGLDHLAFILALILSASALRPLLVQISVFTVAHSVTLVLGVLNIVVLNSLWVEIAIALSIAFVAIENLFIKYRLAWRSLIIFGFGLLHGLGFAGALSDLGIPDLHFVSALLGFNLGIELAQILVGLVVFLPLHNLVKEKHFKSWVFIPGNTLVALAGIYWLVERAL